MMSISCFTWFPIGELKEVWLMGEREPEHRMISKIYLIKCFNDDS